MIYFNLIIFKNIRNFLIYLLTSTQGINNDFTNNLSEIGFYFFYTHFNYVYKTLHNVTHNIFEHLFFLSSM